MGKIQILADAVASQVAAGEVVERPASLIKELVENSLDAGARRISVEFARGGLRQVTVRDDGCGMDRADAELSLQRHATSKIRSSEDLSRVRTMGFRGEALPSIASVSRFRLVTRPADAPAGTEIIVEGGRIDAVRDAGAPTGTQIDVRDLFFNVPARRKFVRGEETESAHIVQGLHALALAHPGVALDARRDGRGVLTLPRADSLAVRIRDLFGAEHLAKLIEVTPLDGPGFRLSGFLARPGHGRRDRLQQFVILNGRAVACPAVQQPLREAYAGVLNRGEQPVGVLHIEMDTALVDCNVHPAKREVRLSRPDALRQAVYDAAAEAIARARERVVVSTPAVPARPMPAPAAPSAPRAFAPAEPQRTMPLPPTSRAEPTLPEIPLPAPPEDRFRLIGPLGDEFLVLEGEEGLVLLDLRAAAERILYEALMKQIEAGSASSQKLLLPVVAELPARERAWVVEHLEDLQAAGFFIEPFGATALKIESQPAAAGSRDPQHLLHEIVSALRAAGRLTPGRAIREALARSVSRLAADQIHAFQPDRARRTIRELLACDLPYASPAGRPTMIQFSFAELDRKFGRTNPPGRAAVQD